MFPPSPPSPEPPKSPYDFEPAKWDNAHAMAENGGSDRACARLRPPSDLLTFPSSSRRTLSQYDFKTHANYISTA